MDRRHTMRFLVGLLLGVALTWWYRAQRSDTAARQRLAQVSGVLQQIPHTATSEAIKAAQRVVRVVKPPAPDSSSAAPLHQATESRPPSPAGPSSIGAGTPEYPGGTAGERMSP